MKISQLTFKQFFSILKEDNQALLSQLNAQLAALDQRINATVTPLQKQRATLAQRITALQKQLAVGAQQNAQQQQNVQQNPAAQPTTTTVTPGNAAPLSV